MRGVGFGSKAGVMRAFDGPFAAAVAGRSSAAAAASAKKKILLMRLLHRGAAAGSRTDESSLEIRHEVFRGFEADRQSNQIRGRRKGCVRCGRMGHAGRQ